MSNDVRDIFKKINELSVEDDNTINLYDSFDIELNENFVIETGVVGFMEDGVIVEADESMLEFLDFNGVLLESEELDEGYSSDYYPDAETNPVSNIINKNTTLGKRGGGLVRVGRVYEFSPKGKEFVEMRWNDGTYSTENVKDLHFISGPYENKTVGDVFNSLSGKLRDLDEAADENNPGEYPGRDVGQWMKDYVEYFKNKYPEELWRLFCASSGDYLPAKIRAGRSLAAFKENEHIYNELKKQNPEAAATGRNNVNPQSLFTFGPEDDRIVNKNELSEAEYQGRKVPLGKPMQGDVKKSKVYVKKPNGKVVKVNFGDKNMRIKKSNPNRRKSFRARHNCANPGPRWKARYWSCRAW